MSLSILTNVGALQATNQLGNNQNNLNESIAQLSSGKRIVTAANDPAGLAISLEMNGLLGALNQAESNTNNGSALLQTADGALANIGNSITTMQQLATEAADGSLNSTQLTDANAQYQTLFGGINTIAQGAQFNGISLLTGSTVTLQTGPLNNANSEVSVGLPSITAANLLGVTLPTAGTLLNSAPGAGQNVEIVGPSADTGISIGTTTGETAGASNQAITAAVNGEVNTSNLPASVTITVQSSTGGSTGKLGTDTITFQVADSNGTSGTVTLSGTKLAIGNVDGLGFDLNVGASGNTLNVGDKITLTFGAPGAGSNLLTQAAAQTAITNTTSALATVAQDRAQIGASEQQLTTVAANLQTYSQNLTSALSNIQDANIAQTFAKFTQQSVLQQANVQVLRSADNLPQQLLSLFQ